MKTSLPLKIADRKHCDAAATGVPQSTEPPRRSGGFSLVELMVAMVTGLILTAGLLQVFAASKKSYRLASAQSRLQENARYALEVMTKDVRMAGYQGCASFNGTSPITPIVIAKPPASMTIDTVLRGNEATGTTWQPALSASLTKVTTGTDVITLRYGGSCGGYLVGNTDPNNANIQIPTSNTCAVGAGDALLISDCKMAHIFRVTSASKGKGKQTIAHAKNNNDCNKFRINTACKPGSSTENYIYGPDAEIMKFQSYTYFIRQGAGGEPALWRLDNNAAVSGSNPVELVEGIYDLQIFYGEDTDTTADGIANTYRTANDVTAWDKVAAVRIRLSLRSAEDFLTHQKQTYTYAGETVTDQRLRRTFTTTIGVRNRLI